MKTFQLFSHKLTRAMVLNARNSGLEPATRAIIYVTSPKAQATTFPHASSTLELPQISLMYV